MNKVFFVFIVLILITLTVFSSGMNSYSVSIKNTEQVPGNPVDLSKVIVRYENTMNGDGLYRVLVDECKNGTLYEKTNLWRENISRNYLKRGVNFSSENTHDFSDIKCIATDKNNNKVSINCKGTWSIKNKNGEIVDKANINNNIYLISIDGRFKYCPKSCCDFDSY